jgi:hypothetical protein
VKAEAGRNLFITRSAGRRLDGRSPQCPPDPALSPRWRPIETSIYETALKLGAGDQQVVDYASVFAYDVDFQREIHPGDSFEMVYETYTDEAGHPVKTGNLIYAAERPGPDAQLLPLHTIRRW